MSEIRPKSNTDDSSLSNEPSSDSASTLQPRSQPEPDANTPAGDTPGLGATVPDNRGPEDRGSEGDEFETGAFDVGTDVRFERIRAEDAIPIVESSDSNRRYTVDSEINRGGMGIVFKVRDESLSRDLAMKVILGQAEGDGSEKLDAELTERFVREAEITGQLDHPGVVPIHEIGTDQEGRKYFTMRLVKGHDLHRIFRKSKQGKTTWTQTRLLEILIKVCDTLAFAHAKDIIHRDLKPSNIMVGTFGETYVMDWGLAKILQACDEQADTVVGLDATGLKDQPKSNHPSYRGSHGETLPGSVMGTPAYMSPEQAKGRVGKLDRRSDVYSVGTMLYELLAGHPPYRDRDEIDSTDAVIKAVEEGPPTPLAYLNQQAPPELIAVCEKAMARSRSSRYQSASEMATDLRAFLEHRVVSAYSSGRWAELKKWVVRNKSLTIATTAGVVIALVLMATIIVNQRSAHKSLKEAKKKTDDALVDSRKQQRRAGAAFMAGEAREVSATNPGLAVLYAKQAVQLNDELENRATWHRARANNAEILTIAGHIDKINAVAYSPNGRLLAIASDDSTASIWSLEENKRLRTLLGHTKGVTWITWSADGTRVATASSDGTAALWNIETGQREVTFDSKGEDSPHHVSISGDLKWCVTSTFEACQLWNARTGEWVLDIGERSAKTFFTDNDRTVVVPGMGGVRFYEIEGGHEQSLPHSGFVNGARMSGDGKFLLASVHRPGVSDLYFWDILAKTKKTLWRGEREVVSTMVLSRDGKLAVVGTMSTDTTASYDGAVRVLDLVTGKETRTIRFEKPVASVCLTRDGEHFMVASGNACQVFSWRPDERPIDLLGHEQRVKRVIAGKDETIVTASDDGTVRIWRPFSGRDAPLLAGTKTVVQTHLNSSGDRIAWLNENVVTLKSVPDGRRVANLSHDEQVKQLAFSPDGRWLATLTVSGKVKVWDAGAGAILLDRKSVGLSGELEFAASGNEVVVIDPDRRQIGKWNLSNGEFSILNWEDGDYIQSVIPGFVWIFRRPDGRHYLLDTRTSETSERELGLGRVRAGHEQIYVFSPNKELKHFDLRQNTTRQLSNPDSSSLLNGYFDSQGLRFAANLGGKTAAAVWDSKSGEQIRELDGHLSSAIKVLFGLSNGALVTYSRGDVYLWEGSERRKPLTRAGLSSPAQAYIDQSGQRIVVAHGVHETTIWDSHGELKEVLPFDWRVRRVAAGALIFRDDQKAVRLWNLSSNGIEPRQLDLRELRTIRSAYDDETLFAKAKVAFEQGPFQVLQELSARDDLDSDAVASVAVPIVERLIGRIDLLANKRFVAWAIPRIEEVLRRTRHSEVALDLVIKFRSQRAK